MVAVGLVGGMRMEGECEKVKAFTPLAQPCLLYVHKEALSKNNTI